MRHLLLLLAALSSAQGTGGQTPLKTIKDGALDRIELYVASLDTPTDLTVLIQPFDSSLADLGTGNKTGKEARRQEARTMQDEAPRVLAERFVTTLQKSGPFKIDSQQLDSQQPNEETPTDRPVSRPSRLRVVGLPGLFLSLRKGAFL